jgi:hypothetical protein
MLEKKNVQRHFAIPCSHRLRLPIYTPAHPYNGRRIAIIATTTTLTIHSDTSAILWLYDLAANATADTTLQKKERNPQPYLLQHCGKEKKLYTYL